MRSCRVCSSGPGLDAQLGDEPGPPVPEHLQRLGGPAAPVQGQHELARRPSRSGCSSTDVAVSSHDRLDRPAGRQVLRDRQLDRGHAALVEVAADPVAQVVGGHVGHERAAPQGQRRAQLGRAPRRIGQRPRRATRARNRCTSIPSAGTSARYPPARPRIRMPSRPSPSGSTCWRAAGPRAGTAPGVGRAGSQSRHGAPAPGRAAGTPPASAARAPQVVDVRPAAPTWNLYPCPRRAYGRSTVADASDVHKGRLLWSSGGPKPGCGAGSRCAS